MPAPTVGVGRKKIIDTMPPDLLAEVMAVKHYLHNISEESFYMNRTYGFYPVIGVHADQDYTTLEISAAVIERDMGDNTFVQSIERAETIAKDVAASINGNVGDGAFSSFNGVFASPHAIPT